ncbi:MAG: molybdopterin oxidoreductase [Betaproteobacteria bacterium RIFCSPLOWO2_02_FULL_65_24]|nr:MAG: molybdopterin oxidoreductase [Betaproteobacteria bacterium RIFCSPLOWO2_02_FULL_65_24]
MAESCVYRELGGTSPRYWGLLALLAVPLALGAAAYFYIEHYGHIVTGMDNQIVWGMPHVFAVFLIVAATGALNVAMAASVFGKAVYKPVAPLSALVSVALLAGGLALLMLDLGRSDRMIVAMTHLNAKSIFALRVVLYNGFLATVAVYFWFMLERRMHPYIKAAAILAFLWQLVLVTGTGLMFGFMVARAAYDSALYAPMFIAFSSAYGTAVFILILLAVCNWEERPISGELMRRLKNLLGIFVGASLYFAALFHFSKYYVARSHDAGQFLLFDGGVYTTLFWLGQVAIGGIVPLALLLRSRPSRRTVAAACALVVLGGLAQMYVTIIGGQAYPQILFPGMVEASSFFDGEIHPYTPSVPEVLLGLGGAALAAAIVAVALRALALLPERLDQAVGPQA